MENIESLINSLWDNNDKIAYPSFKQLLAESEKTNAVYAYFDTLAGMINSDHSYFRTRAMLLIAANAKWDDAGKIDKIIAAFLSHIMDDKPITARQIIKALPEIAKYKPDLRGVISSALKNAGVEKYAETMRHLIEKDIAAAVKDIEKIGK
jgi:hypothetical protein